MSEAPVAIDSASSNAWATLADVARLAGVRRPVVSMWRARFASGPSAFPAPVTAGPPARFDVDEVAAWLASTGHGNTPDPQADAALWGIPDGLDFTAPTAIDELEALIVLRAALGELGALSPAGLRAVAAEADPADTMLRREVEAHAEGPLAWTLYVDRLVDAAYGAADALRLIADRARQHGRPRGRISPTADALAAELVADLARRAVPDAVSVVVHGASASTTLQLAREVGVEVPIAVAQEEGAEVRRARRRLLLDGRDLPVYDGRGAAVHLVCPEEPLHDAKKTLAAIDEVTLSLRDDDAVVLLGSARLLVHELPPTADRSRSDLLRTGRVRAIALLPTGLIDAAPREALALWVLAAPAAAVALDERHTMIADLTSQPLTDAARGDLVSDVWASLGPARHVRERAFRFGRFVRTARLLAARGSLVTHPVSPAPQGSVPDSSRLAALLDAAAAQLPSHVVLPATRSTDLPAPARPAMSVAEAVAEGHARVISGVRLGADLVGGSGLALIGDQELSGPSSIGARRVDQLSFAAAHPRAALTRPGDVVFRTSPRPSAWVDPEGSSVVVYPARVLRIRQSDPGGLIAELVAADIRAARTTEWRRWMLRRVAPFAMASLRGAIAQLEQSRAEIEATLAALDRYADLLTAGVVAGAVTVTPVAEPSVAPTAPSVVPTDSILIER